KTDQVNCALSGLGTASERVPTYDMDAASGWSVTMSDSVLIRTALNADIPAIANIYEHYVRTQTSTFEIDPPDRVEISARIDRIQSVGLPYLVAEQNGLVLGYSYAGPYRTRAAYRHT